jgi:SAM-dependent methyltransferase
VDWTKPGLLQFTGSYWGVCALHTGVKLDIFSQLAHEPQSHTVVARKCSSNPRATAMLLDALAALGLLVKANEKYSLTDFAATHLVNSSADYLGHIITHHHHLMFSWAQLVEAVKSGAPVGGSVAHGDDAEMRKSFLMGMYNLASQLAPLVAAKVDLGGCRRLLDLGGGPGTYAIHFCLQNPALAATVFDLPTTRNFAEECVARFGLSKRISFHPGNYEDDVLPAGFDAVWLSHILHSEGEEQCLDLLRKAAAVLEPGGRLMVQDFMLADEKSAPLFPALFSLNMLVNTPQGRSYSTREIVAMLAAAGLHDISVLEIDLPNGAGIVSGIK